MENTIQRSHVLRIVAIDAVLVTLVLFLPMVIHTIGGWVRFLEPMRLVLLAAILFVPERKNAYVMAFFLPWLSFAVVGIPVWWKAVMMSVELVVNVFFYYCLTDMKLKAGISVLISILLAKTLYYVAKYVSIQISLLPEMPLIENLLATLIYVMLLSAMFHVVYKIKKQ